MNSRFSITTVLLILAVVSIGVHHSSYGMPVQGMGRLGDAGGLASDKSFLETLSGYFKEAGLSMGHALQAQTKRTSPNHVGAVMAILATFDQARVLPPESSPKANQLIRSLIQFQSAFMNQDSHAVQQYVSEALSTQLGQQGVDVHAQFPVIGWTSTSMEALVDYSAQHPFWSRPGIRDALSRYNLSPDDWDLVVAVFTQAREQFRMAGKDLHEIFAAQRQSMPGGKG